MKNTFLLFIFIGLALTNVKALELQNWSHLFFKSVTNSKSDEPGEQLILKQLLKCGFHADSLYPICHNNKTFTIKDSGTFLKKGSWFSSDQIYNYSYILNINTNIQYLLIKAQDENSMRVFNQIDDTRLINYDVMLNEEYIETKFNMIFSLDTYPKINQAIKKQLQSEYLDLESYSSLTNTYSKMLTTSKYSSLIKADIFNEYLIEISTQDSLKTKNIDQTKELLLGLSNLFIKNNLKKVESRLLFQTYKELLISLKNSHHSSLSIISLSLLNKHFENDFPLAKSILLEKMSSIEDLSLYSYIYDDLSLEYKDQPELVNSLLISATNHNENISRFALDQITKLEEGNIDTIEKLLIELKSSNAGQFIEERIASFSLDDLSSKQQADLYIKYFHSNLSYLSTFSITKLISLNLGDNQLGQIISEDSLEASIEILGHYDSPFVVDKLIHFAKIGQSIDSINSVKKLASKTLNDEQLVVLHDIIKTKYNFSNNEHFLLFVNILDAHKNKVLSASLFESNISRFSKLKIYNSTKSLRQNKDDKTYLLKLNKDLGKLPKKLELKVIKLTLQSLSTTNNLEVLKLANDINDYRFRIKILKKLMSIGSKGAISLIIDYLSDEYTAVRRKASKYIVQLKDQISSSHIEKLTKMIVNKSSHWRSKYIAIKSLQSLNKNTLIQKMIQSGQIKDKDIIAEL